MLPASFSRLSCDSERTLTRPLGAVCFAKISRHVYCPVFIDSLLSSFSPATILSYIFQLILAASLFLYITFFRRTSSTFIIFAIIFLWNRFYISFSFIYNVALNILFLILNIFVEPVPYFDYISRLFICQLYICIFYSIYKKAGVVFVYLAQSLPLSFFWFRLVFHFP